MRRQPAGDYDYDEVGGAGYSGHRRTDPRIASLVHDALGSAASVINVGAGTGSYEPTDRAVTAVEPSAAMRAQRPAGSAEAIDAVAEELPFADDSFDAAMATVTIHQWRDTDAGLREMRRVSRGPVVLLTADPEALLGFWLREYAPALVTTEASRFPTIDHVRGVLGGTATVTAVPIPLDCIDGFGEAFYGRPELLLDPAVRLAQSGWGFIDPAEADRSVERLRAALESGAWDRRYGVLRSQPDYIGSIRLITARATGRGRRRARSGEGSVPARAPRG